MSWKMAPALEIAMIDSESKIHSQILCDLIKPTFFSN